MINPSGRPDGNLNNYSQLTCWEFLGWLSPGEGQTLITSNGILSNFINKGVLTHMISYPISWENKQAMEHLRTIKLNLHSILLHLAVSKVWVLSGFGIFCIRIFVPRSLQWFLVKVYDDCCDWLLLFVVSLSFYYKYGV